MNIIYQYLDLIIENYNWEIGYDETQEFLNQLNDEKFLWFYNTFVFIIIIIINLGFRR